MNLSKKSLDDLTYEIIECCINVHKALGAGLLESIYHQCLIEELKYKGFYFSSELTVPVHYRNVELDTRLRADLFIENCLVLKLKAVEKLLPIFDAQLLTYMKLLKAPKGIIINFNCNNLFHEGQKTFVNEYFRNLPE